MKAIVVSQDHKISIQDVPVPSTGPNEILVKVPWFYAAGMLICLLNTGGTRSEQYR